MAFIIPLIISLKVTAQSDSLRNACEQRNAILYPEYLQGFYQKLSDSAKRVTVLQLGDSHVQMGDLPAGLGASLQLLDTNFRNVSFWFPYKQTWGSDPVGKRVKVSGKWRGAKMVGSAPETHFALSGHALIAGPQKEAVIGLQSEKSSADWEFLIEQQTNWKWKVRRGVVSVEDTVGRLQVVRIHFRKPVNEFNMKFHSRNTGDSLRIFGIRETVETGNRLFIAYGSSGAQYREYTEKCDLGADELRMIQPDLVIVSLGTNDAHKTYTADEFYKKVSVLLTELRSSSPGCSVLLTTQPDTYFRGSEPVSDSVVFAVLERVALEFQCGLWNLKEVMGGEGSIHYWLKEGLASADLLHLTPAGYLFQGELMAQALLKAFENNRFR